MKKLILATIVYDMPGQTELVTRQKLVVINSSRTADENHDTEAAVAGCKEWFEKSGMVSQGANYVSITAEPTIDADNTDPQPLYTTQDLVTFGNYILSDKNKQSPVNDGDLEDWKRTHRK